MYGIEEAAPRAERPSTVGTLAYLLNGLLIWAVQFTLVYGGHTLICISDIPDALAIPMIIAVTAVAALALVGILLAQDRVARALGVGPRTAGRKTYDALARLMGILSLIAVVWSGEAAVVLAACTKAR